MNNIPMSQVTALDGVGIFEDPARKDESYPIRGSV